MKKLIAAAVISLAVTSPALAQDRYVSDTLIINFRSGPSNEYKITKRLKSGDKLQLLETSGDNRWAKVKVSDGTEGWVLSQYLERNPTANIVAKQQATQINQLNAKIAELEAQLSQTSSSAEAVSSELVNLKTENSRLESELIDLKRTSSNALNLEKENIQLTEQNRELTLELDTVNAKLDRVQSDDFTTYLIVGASIFFSGLIVPALLGIRRRPQAKGGWH